MKTKHMTTEQWEKVFGVEPGELYGANEHCYTDTTKHTFNGRAFDVFYDQMAQPLSQWKAFCIGIGTISNLEREAVIAEMRKRLA